MAESKAAQIYQATQPYLHYLKEVIEKRLQHYFDSEPSDFDIQEVPVPEPDHWPSPIRALIVRQALSPEEIITLLVALAPHVIPVFFDTLFQQYIPSTGDFPQLGGVRGKNYRGFLPTVETVLFILAGNNWAKRLSYQHLFSTQHTFARQSILWLDDVPAGEPEMSGKLMLSPDYVELLITGNLSYPKLSIDFPAQHITTVQDWEDLVLNTSTRRQIEDLEMWVNHHTTLMETWGMSKKLKPGYRALFYGPPGTGKTLAATLLGKYTKREVFKIDLSMIVSKYIGETEKNLSRLFDKAENKDWILFFDEADALFGKRTNIRDAHDKYANQEASYLLQKIEQYNGLVVLATNFKDNMDEAFLRRFQSVIHFPLPSAEDRLKIWTNAFPTNVKFNEDMKLDIIARKYELSGSGIMSVVQYACLQALSHASEEILQEYILKGIKYEYAKENRVW